MSIKKFKCPFCNKIYVDKKLLHAHLENKHKSQIPKGMTAAQFYFNLRNNKTGGKCIICGKPTKWNEGACRYDRICSERCQNEYRKLFLKRMKAAGKENQMNDPEHQKKMLRNRKISGTYKWSDGSKEFVYTGSYEKDFLEFMDIFMHWNSSDIMMPAPQIFEYKYGLDEDGKDKIHFYIPDVFIPSINLILEIKASDNRHYRARDIQIEQIKDKIVSKTKFRYFKIFDKKYDDFYKLLLQIINE